jgi:hypothetical protein
MHRHLHDHCIHWLIDPPQLPHMTAQFGQVRKLLLRTVVLGPVARPWLRWESAGKSRPAHIEYELCDKLQ